MNPVKTLNPCTSHAAGRLGFTLIELLVAMVVMAMISVVLTGVLVAVHTVRLHSTGIEEACAQSNASMQRIERMVAQTGTYRRQGEKMTVGLRVVTRVVAGVSRPEILVVWCGGRTGGAQQSGSTSHPPISELLVYAPSPASPEELVELAFPAAAGSIDFRASDFDTTILNLIDGGSGERLVLCDRLRVVSGPGYSAACIRFHLRLVPTDAEVNVQRGSQSWYDAPWGLGVVSRASGLRQALLDVELQLATVTSGDSDTFSLPFFGFARVPYAYY